MMGMLLELSMMTYLGSLHSLGRAERVKSNACTKSCAAWVLCLTIAARRYSAAFALALTSEPRQKYSVCKPEKK